MRAIALPISLVSLVAACGGSSSTIQPDGPVDVTPVGDPAREIVHTKLEVDVTALTGKATITFGPSETPGATLEVGNEMVQSVKLDGADLATRAGANPMELELALPSSDQPLTVEIAYKYALNEQFEGASKNGFTLVWPYWCGNLFPCHSAPSDGTTFELALAGVPAGKTAVYPQTITNEAPSYQIAWAIDEYLETAIGTTTAGTQIVAYHRASEASAIAQGTMHLVDAFDWFEKTLGPYKFGPKAGTVSAKWGAGAFGGMEHHPFWHVGIAAIGDVETNVHEAAHGWFGDGIRLRCWEDFVLSEGTVTYLAGRALDVVAPSVGATVWQNYANELPQIEGTLPVWPQSCGAIDILDDNLFTRAPYIRGAFFYRALAMKVGADKVDEVLAAFYAEYALKPASMSDMLAKIQAVTGYDATACANTWLTSSTTPTIAACP